ncbi:50S ribosomal protein L17 [Thermodesulfatator atlanticus]|uniref:50S ribosomal protein L17 n=1 Tax=Thermodesulfatator atlanticus TaxID=501497 RepID=UPI0003B59136
MRHRKKSRRLVGSWEHRKALLRNLLVALFINERIQTTEAKAKELRRLADKMITLAKRGDLAARRQALSILPNKAVVRKLFGEIKDRYAYRQSGFTRIVRIGPRRGDAAMMVIIELVTDKLEHKPSKKEVIKTEEKPVATEKTEETAKEEAAPKAEEQEEISAAEQTAEKSEEETQPEAKTEEKPEAEEKPEEKEVSEEPQASQEVAEEATQEKTEEKAEASQEEKPSSEEKKE